MYAVTVTFRILFGRMAALLPLVRVNARRSLQSEVGCHRFDVATNPVRPDEVFLYGRARHFDAFEAEAAGVVADKSVGNFADVHPCPQIAASAVPVEVLRQWHSARPKMTQYRFLPLAEPVYRAAER